MSLFQRILCPIDFSDPSNRALEMAKELTKDLGAELTVLHVVDTRLPSLGNLYPLQDAVPESRRRADQEMNRWKEEAKLPQAHWEVVEGTPHRAIVERSKKGDVDLVIMASHGYSGVERLLLGSVTEKVLHQIETPILVVGPSGDGSYQQVVQKPLRTILLAVDFGPLTPLCDEYASALARRYKSKLFALHVLSPLADVLGGPLWPAPPAGLTQISQDVKTQKAAEMQKLFGTAEGFETESLIWEGDVARTIVRLAKEKEVDLLVMGAHSRTELSWLGSTCHKVIRTAPCPVLAVRSKD